MSLAFVLLERGSVTAALRQADRSAGQSQGLAAARLSTQRALILQRTGRGAEALAAYARALPVLRRGHDTVWEARLRNNRGLLHAYHGSLRDAEADLRVALALHESAGASLSAADSWWNLGFVAARRGDAPTALQHFDAAAEIYRRHGLPVQELMLDRVELLLGVGAVGEARRTARRAVAGLEAAALGLHLPEALLLLAQATIADGRPEEASPVAAEAARLFAVQGRPAWAVLARYVGVLADERAGHNSAKLLRESLAVAESLRRSRWRVHELDIRLTAAQLAMTRGDQAPGGRAAAVSQPGTVSRPARGPAAWLVRRGPAATRGRPARGCRASTAGGHDPPRTAPRSDGCDRAADARGGPRPRPRLARAPPRGPGPVTGARAGLGGAVACGCVAAAAGAAAAGTRAGRDPGRAPPGNRRSRAGPPGRRVVASPGRAGRPPRGAGPRARPTGERPALDRDRAADPDCSGAAVRTRRRRAGRAGAARRPADGRHGERATQPLWPTWATHRR